MIVVITLLTFLSTLLGGALGLKYKDKKHIILGFTAGVLLGVVAFDVLPEINRLVIQLNTDFILPMLALVAGFLIFHLLEKSLLIHHAEEDAYGHHMHPNVGSFSALALIAHSFLDGVGIGIGFQINTMVGILVSIAVISHDFADGLNTVSLVLVSDDNDKKAVKYLVMDALAPILGAIATTYIKIPAGILLMFLGFFAGFLLYIGVSDILPEAHREKSSYLTVLMTALGTLLIFTITRFL